jgi:ParB family chromosome partitioning protein
MAKFGINDILNAKSKAEAAGTTDQYKEIYLSPYEVKAAPENTHQKLEGIEELADSFLHVGQESPTVLARIKGEFYIIDGHRRNAANILNLERGHQEYKKVLYRYKDMSEAMYELSLLAGNGYTQPLTAYEKTRLVERTKAALIRAKEEDGLEIQGKMRDLIAAMLNESSTNVARMESINNNAAPEIKEQLKSGNMGITAAYEAAKLPEEEQKAIAEKVAGGENLRAKEIAAKVAEKTAAKAAEDAEQAQADYEKQQEESDKEIEKAERKRKEAEEKAQEAEIAAQHAKVLREWVKESVSAATKAAADAVLKVSETDTPQNDWNNTEWVVFTARAIMQQADNVSEDDLYLLHEIMIRCENAATETDGTEQIPGQQSIEEYMTPEETESEEKQNE